MHYQSFQCLLTLKGHGEAVESITISLDGKTLISGSWDKTIKLWNFSNAQLQAVLEVHRSPLTSVALSPDGITLASASWDKTVKLVDLKTGVVKHSLEIYESERNHIVDSIVFSADSQTVYTGTRNGSTYYWDVSTGEELGNLGIAAMGCALLAISANGQRLVGSYLNTLQVWQLPTHKRQHSIRTSPSAIASVAISADAVTIATGHQSGDIHLWSASTGEMLATLKAATVIVTAVAFSPDGKTLASGSEQGALKLWNIDSQVEVCTLKEHTADVTRLVFSPDGETLISASADQTLKVWVAL